MVININYRKVPVVKKTENNNNVTVDYLAVETVINLHYNDVKITSLLGSPCDVGYLILGHLIAEGYLEYDQTMSIKNSVTTHSVNNGIEVYLRGDASLAIESKSSGITSTSCGACNTDGLDDLIKTLPIINSKINFCDSILHPGLQLMKSQQVGFSKTGGMHSAGLLSSNGLISCFAEDIGRHNAVDKVIGKSLDIAEHDAHILLLSGRCGWDIVAKASRANIPVIASIGACSTLAADCARALGIKIYSFVRESSHTIIG